VLSGLDNGELGKHGNAAKIDAYKQVEQRSRGMYIVDGAVGHAET